MKILGKASAKFFGFVLLILVLTFVFSPIIKYNSSGVAAFGEIEAARNVYLGGFPVGVSIKPDGVMVCAIVPIETEAGLVYPSTQIKPGDLIKKVGQVSILYVNDLTRAVKEFDKANAVMPLEVLRDGEILSVESVLIKEDITSSYKLGFAVRDSVAGIGTVTFVKPDLSFACLGHPICDSETSKIIPCFKGESYDCQITGYNKGVRGKAGELKGVFVGGIPSGILFKNDKFGISGKFNNIANNLKLMEIGNRSSVVVGNAQIYTTIDSVPQYYDIEIIKAVSQNIAADKSMVIRVIDKQLIAATGGILQGMSGSPIIQNNKIIGAVTHVFINDPTKGYGVYADWMYGM